MADPAGEFTLIPPQLLPKKRVKGLKREQIVENKGYRNDRVFGSQMVAV
jgi:hypothetical protein